MTARIEQPFATGYTLYAIIKNSSGSYWNGSSFESFNGSNWTTYDVALSEDGTCGLYGVSFPAVGAGKYSVFVFRQKGGSPAQSDAPPVGGASFVLDSSSNEVSTPTTASIADAVWDEAISSGVHDTAGTAGERLQAIDDKLPSGTISDFNEVTDGVNLNASQTGVTIGTVNALGSTATGQVNAEMADVLTVDTVAEQSSGAPPSATTIAKMIGYLYMTLRNKNTQTSTEFAIYNNAGTKIAKATCSDNGVTFTKENLIAP